MSGGKVTLDTTMRRADADYWRLLAARLLAKYLLEVKRERALGDGFEHAIWADLADVMPLEQRLTVRDRALLRGLAEACGGWVRWTTEARHPLGDEHLSGAEWVAMTEWRAMHEARRAA